MVLIEYQYLSEKIPANRISGYFPFTDLQTLVISSSGSHDVGYSFFCHDENGSQVFVLESQINPDDSLREINEPSLLRRIGIITSKNFLVYDIEFPISCFLPGSTATAQRAP